MACEDMVEWQLLSPEYQYMTISVNISGKHFSEPGLVEHIRDVLEQTGIYPPCLKLEITESAIMRDAENTTAILREIKDMGVQLSIDDFGTGYSSLSYLHRFPVDTLKIDRSFVSTMEDGTENGEIVRTVITLARALKMNVIAEGIESIHQLHQLRILNCEYGQGFLFSRAVPAHEVRQLFDEEVWWKNIPPVRDSAFHPDQTPIELVEVPVTH
jgi:EAL domain-containing protein (putative c-di-GMP-specific phosphodiesterase class I)